MSPWTHECHRNPARPLPPGRRRDETCSAARCCDSWLRKREGRQERNEEELETAESGDESLDKDKGRRG